jgi:glutathione synthase/RimK-type ligase-like ATP-grasp enzyme
MAGTHDAPTVLFVGGSGPGALSEGIATLALAQARARGLRTHVLNDHPADRAPGEVRELADDWTELDFTDAARCAAWAARQAAAGTRFDVVFGVREYAQVAVAEVAAALGLPGNPPETVRRVRAKDACRAALAAAGFAQPRFRLCTDAGGAAEFLAATRGPWVVKPRDAMGSLGVSRVDGPDDLPRALAALPDQASFLVEEFVTGPEYSVEGVFLGGRPQVLAITEKQVLPPPTFVEAGHVLPAPLPEDTAQEIERTVEAALLELGLRHGLFHVELWLTATGVVLGEVHSRPGGDWIHLLLGHAIPGLELFGLVYDDALGRAPVRPQRPSRAAAALFLTAPRGVLTGVDGWEQAVAHPAVLHADLSVRPGDTVGPVRESLDRLGVVVAGADDPATARELTAGLAASVQFHTDPHHTDPHHTATEAGADPAGVPSAAG